jgi:pimeloyl-ACP methyl ester carboxylesterase
VSRIATRLFFMPPRPRSTVWSDNSIFGPAEELELFVEGRKLRAWRFGAGPQVLVQHGWGGRTAQMSRLIRVLVDSGYAVLAMDAPGHGDSGWRPASSIVHFSRAIEELLARHGPAFATIAHSLGGSAVAHSMARGASTGALILVAPFSRPASFYQGFLKMLGLKSDEIARAQARIEQKLGLRFAELDLLRNLNLGRSPALIVHDEGDRRVPFSGSTRIADRVPQVRLHATQGLGHSRLLADPGVHQLITATLDDLPGLRVEVGRGHSDQHWLTVPSMSELLADLEYEQA